MSIADIERGGNTFLEGESKAGTGVDEAELITQFFMAYGPGTRGEIPAYQEFKQLLKVSENAPEALEAMQRERTLRPGSYIKNQVDILRDLVSRL